MLFCLIRSLYRDPFIGLMETKVQSHLIEVYDKNTILVDIWLRYKMSFLSAYNEVCHQSRKYNNNNNKNCHHFTCPSGIIFKCS